MTARPLFFQTIRAVQAFDLPTFRLQMSDACHGNIAARIDGEWREVLDVLDDNSPQADDVLGVVEQANPDSREMRNLLRERCWVVLRYIVEEKCKGGYVATGLHAIRSYDLVEVQVPVPAAIPRAGAPR